MTFGSNSKGERLRYGSPEQREAERRYQRLAEKARASERMFSSARVQEAVNTEWRFGGCRNDALKAFCFYCFYLLVFTLSAIYSTGQNRPHGYYMTEGIRQTLLETPFSYRQAPNPTFQDVSNITEFWLWTQVPLLQGLIEGQNVTWHSKGVERSFVSDCNVPQNTMFSR